MFKLERVNYFGVYSIDYVYPTVYLSHILNGNYWRIDYPLVSGKNNFMILFNFNTLNYLYTLQTFVVTHVSIALALYEQAGHKCLQWVKDLLTFIKILEIH